MSAAVQDGAARGSQVMHGPTLGPRGRRLQNQQHISGGDHAPDASGKEPEPSTAAGHDTKKEGARPSRLPTLGGRVQSIQHKTIQAKTLVHTRQTTQRSTSGTHKPPPLSYDGTVDADSERNHLGQDVVTEGQRAAVSLFHRALDDGSSSESKVQAAQLDGVQNEGEELLFASFAPLALVEKPRTTEEHTKRSNVQALLHTAYFAASPNHEGHPVASKIRGAAQDHFPTLSHEGHEYPTEEDASGPPSPVAAPASQNEFQDALEELQSALREALRLASQAANQERQQRTEAVARLPGVRALRIENTQASHSLKTQLGYTRVKTKKKAGFWRGGKSSEEADQPSASPGTQGAPPSELPFTLQIPPRTDSLPMAWPPSDDNERDNSATPARLKNLAASSPHSNSQARGQGILPMPPPKKNK